MYIKYMKLFTRNLNCAKHTKHAKRFNACAGLMVSTSVSVFGHNSASRSSNQKVEKRLKRR